MTQLIESAAEKLARLMTATGVNVVYSPTVKVPCADLDAGMIYMPAMPDELTREEHTKMHGTLDHEAAHIIFTKMADGTNAIKPKGADGHIMNCFEDGRINRLMGEMYVGSQYNISEMYRLISPEVIAKTNEALREEKDPAKAAQMRESFSKHLAMSKAATVYVWGDESAAEGMDAADSEEWIARMSDDLKDQLRAIETVEDVLAAIPPIKEWLELVDPPKDEQEQDEQEQDEQDESGEGDGQGESDSDEDSDGGNDSDGEPSDESDEDSDEDSEGGSDSKPETAEDGESGEADAASIPETVNDGDLEPTDEEGGPRVDTIGRVESFDEVGEQMDRDREEAIAVITVDDGYHGRYIVDTSYDVEHHVKDMKMDETPRAHTAMSALLFGSVREKVGAMRARLVLDLQSTGKVWSKNHESGRRLDRNKLHRPSVGDARVFRNKVKREQVNTAVTLLVDCSGSMNGGRIETAMQLAGLFCDALELANVPCEVLGFTTADSFHHDWCHGTPTTGCREEALHHIVLKDFNERAAVNRHHWTKIANNCNNVLWCNVDGESVLWAAKRLHQRREERKVMFVFSDGCPSADAYGLENHLKYATETVEKSGVDLIGVGIQSREVKRFYTNYVIYNGLNDLMTGFYKTISTLLRTGSLRAAA
jgi:cobalamin biosynthesis protein CobT